MPCKGIIHPITRSKVGWDAMDSDASWRGGRAAAPAWVVRYLEHIAATDDRHNGLNVTNTRTTTCPRETFIRVLLDYWRDPTKAFVPTRGTALHEIAGAYWPANYLTEERDRELLTLRGTLFGVEITSHADVVRVATDIPVRHTDGDAYYNSRHYTYPGPRPLEIINTKFPMDWSVKWRSGKDGMSRFNGQPDDNAIQLNIDRLLLAQQPWAAAAGYDANDVLLTVWDHGCGEGAGPEPLAADHLDEATMLNMRPGGGKWTLGAIVGAHQFALGRAIEAGICDENGVVDGHPRSDEIKQRVCASLPLVGAAGMYSGGKGTPVKCLKYCDVESVCSWLVREYGAPA